MNMGKHLRRPLLAIAIIANFATPLSIQSAVAAQTLVFNNSTGSYGQWNQGVNDIFLNKLTAPVGSVITVIKSGWSVNISTQSPTNTVYIFSDVSNAPSSVAATFTYSSNDGSNWATYTGTYTVPAGGTFWLGQRASSGINNSGGANANQISNGWSISYSTRYYSTSLSGPFTNQGSASSPLWQIYTGTSLTALTAPSAPVVTSTSNTITASETGTTANATSYLVKLFAANGSTLIDSKTATNSTILSGVSFSGLSPNTTYKVGVIAIGDQVTYEDSALSTLATRSTLVAATTTSLSFTGNPQVLIYRTAYQVRATVTGTTGFINFKINGKAIPLCQKVAISASVANCTFKPSTRGQISLAAAFTSTDASYTSSQAVPFLINTVTRSNKR